MTLETLFGADWQIAFVGSCALDLLAVGQQLIEIGFVPCLDPDDNRGSSVVLFEADGTLVRWYRTGLRVERLNGCFQPDQEVTLAPNGFNPVEPAARFSNSLTCLTVEERSEERRVGKEC